ncbi:hypothetical protein HOG07_03200 [Candidatus Woesearchaeota archaeon]|nr:hypothetical protein [Candidatus Woesearchaeota archaeon]MBT4336393.1 hypothetical protein [Candidatus Woesearchaeota archaeon]MBT4469952.1 hypothetical protein [Candidatus Woesearchaeota archaeon]MBT6744324.1 hypothetical protein [Candidatus Woesearchaeota archaeon]
MAENFYKSNLDYNSLFSYSFSGVGSNSFGEIYEENMDEATSNNSETMDTEEAREMLVAVQYAKVLGTMTELSHEKRKQFTNWVTFNKDLMGLFHSMYAVTGDVDYSKSF